MKNISLLFLLASLIFLGNTCNKEEGECHKSIIFKNNSEKALYVLKSTEFPDTLSFGTGPSPELNKSTYKVLSGETSENPLRNRDCWETDFTYVDIIPSDTLMIYIFDADTIENVDWADVVHYYMVLKRYDLSLDDLKRDDWTISYP
ncbi:hypothetical protein [Mariniphaga sediminis]|uniref:hypothetical protein n=1 Tax=Mariniphaga sediminis TaxID=1628158 RepID=UPI00356861C7